MKSIRHALCAAAMIAAAVRPGGRLAAQGTYDLKKVGDAAAGWASVNRSAAVMDSGGTTIVRLDDRPNGGMVWNRSLTLRDGDIEIDVRGRDVFQKSFLGIAFHIASADSLDIVYLRPFNFRSTDSTRRQHAVQYASYPDAPWERLRADHPGAFEAAVPGNADPDAWHHLRLTLRGQDLSVYVDRGSAPVLHVTLQGGRANGGVGLWVGDLSPGDFANLAIRPVR